MDNTAGDTTFPYPLTNGTQAVINAIRAMTQIHPVDAKEIIAALSCKMAKDINSHLYGDIVEDLDALHDYIETEHA